MSERDFSVEAARILDGDRAEAQKRVVELLQAEAAIPEIQQNANDNYVASENRLHACEDECRRLREQLAKDDDAMFARAASQS